MSKKNKEKISELDIASIQKDIARYLKYMLAKDRYTAKSWDRYVALAMTVRDRLVDRWINTQQYYYHENVKRVYYLSLEYLLGRSLGNNIINLGMQEIFEKALSELGLSLDELRQEEVDAGLGNGGLGRLAACFMDSMTTLDLPAMGYGLRYDYGIFRQDIIKGAQVEEPDEWLRFGNVWELDRPEYTIPVNFGGKVDVREERGELKFVWKPAYTVIGIPYNFPIIGYGTQNVNTLRLWSAKASEEFDFEDFSKGDYIEAVSHKIQAENLTKVLYPNDNNYMGKELRFRQQYFFVACSLHDILRRFKVYNKDIRDFASKTAIQLNDTHPTVAIPELMRILLDEEDLDWNTSWEMTKEVFGYTNHTLMPEAQEKWPEGLFEKLLPRHLQIILEIDRRFKEEVSLKYPGDNARLYRMSVMEEGEQRQVRMAYLATIGSHSINGVSELHSNLLKQNLFRDFYEVYPDRFNNKTNGITPRRWLLKSNPEMSDWIIEKIGKGWITDLDQLKKLKKYAGDSNEQEIFRKIKRDNKENLAKIIKEKTNVIVSPDAIFDVQIKRIHEYKRQLLNILHIITLYNRIKENPSLDVYPHVFIFAGKAAPGYFMAKLIIKLICSVADVINRDKSINDKIKVVFLPNYSVSLAERIIPAADISEQISTAGMEASGTGNMKLALNGALTLGTYDGANIEILEEVGEENIFIFGLRAEQIVEQRHHYNPYYFYENDPEIRRTLDLIMSNFFSLHNQGVFKPIIHTLLNEGDRYFVLADHHAYSECHQEAEKVYRDTKEWTKRAILNVAGMGKFSSDRVIKEYAEEIWKIEPAPVKTTHHRGDTVCGLRLNPGLIAGD